MIRSEARGRAKRPAKRNAKNNANRSRGVARVAPQQQRRQAPRKRSSVGRALLSTAGSIIGGAFGGPTGAVVGRSAGDTISSIFGMGDYRVTRNSLLQGEQGPPVFRQGRFGETTVAHREYLGDITGSTAFNLAAYPINPGMATTFPWLSTVADSYEEYEFLGLVFEFKSTSAFALNSTNTALGVVVLATEYDSLDANFATKQQMEAQQFATSTMPANSVLHAIECKKRSNVLSSGYVRNGVPPANSDLRMYDLGNFQIATQGMQAAAVIGELWVSYHVTLRKPQLTSVSGAAHYILDTELATQAAPLGIGSFTPGSASIATYVSPTVLTLPYAGRYLIAGGWYTAANNITAVPSIALGANIAQLGFYNGASGFGLFLAAGGLSNIIRTVTVTAAGTGAANQLTFSGNTGMTVASLDILIVALPFSLT